jgi:TonB family protein
METYAFYLFKSSVWLTGFSLSYFLFLRNERFFVLNRIYLITGLLASLIFPLITLHYTVEFPLVPATQDFNLQIQGVNAETQANPMQNVLLYIYLSGISYLIFRLIKQTLPVLTIIRKSKSQTIHSVKLIQTDRFPASFSFFSFVFVNPSITDTEVNEIVNHELEHISQKHWIDLLLYEALCIVQWMNPMVWLYGRMIRQNHEYLADERALQRSANPAIYRATLLNQMFGGPVIQLANSFNYSLNKKRFNMMKQTISSPLRKLRLLSILPFIAGVLYAFATPEYKFVQDNHVNASAIRQITEKIVKGRVISEEGTPLKSASVIVAGKTMGTITDANGNFELKLTDDSPLVISFVGYASEKVNPDFEKEMLVTLKTKVIGIDPMGNDASAVNLKKKPLILIDGKESTKAEMDKLNPSEISSVSVLKDKNATDKYGEKGKDGVIELTLKSASDNSNTQSFKLQSHEPLIVNSTGGPNDPLVLVDGKMIDDKQLHSLAPQDIESISVLKNASATALYGEKGKNGVILITRKKTGDVFQIVEEMPQFPGGVDALRSFVALTLKYPEDALKKGISGKVFVNFNVDKDGSVTNAKVVRGVDPSLDKEALRIVNSLPKWKPGQQAGEPVKVSYTLPVDFNLPDKN